MMQTTSGTRPMMRPIVALASGALFGAGLTVSTMINPAKVLGFLDVAGDWDPTLALVMIGAIPVAAAGFWLARRLRKPLLAPAFPAPPPPRIDLRLVSGAALFGVGWGLVGYCPGPALASLGFGLWQTILFLAAMVAGMVAARAVTSPPPSVRIADPVKNPG